LSAESSVVCSGEGSDLLEGDAVSHVVGAHVDLHAGVVLVQGPDRAVVGPWGVQGDDGASGVLGPNGVQDGGTAGVPKVDREVCILAHLCTPRECLHGKLWMGDAV